MTQHKAVLEYDQTRTAEKLKESENRFQFMADSMPQLVWITRPDGYHEYYNQRWYDYTGTQPGSTDGKGWNTLFHVDDQERARKSWRHSLKTGEPYEIEYRLYNAPSKSYRWVIGRAMPFKNSSGKILKWYGTCTDIDDQKRGSQLHTFLANASNALFSSLDYNETLENVSALLVPEIADWCSVELLNDDKTALVQVAVAHKDPKKVAWAKELRKEQGPPDLNAPTGTPKVLRTGESEYYPEITDEMLEAATDSQEERDLVRKLGLTSAMTVPLKRVDETIGAITLISAEQQRRFTRSDLEMAEELARRASIAITNAFLYHEAQHEIEQRRILEDKLRAVNEELEQRVTDRTDELEKSNLNLQQSNRELEDFAYVASHDLQEPLRKIQAFSNLLEEEYSGQLGEGKDYVVRMRKAASRMSTLIDDLLSFSRVTTKGRDFELIDLNQVAIDVLEDLETRISQTGGTVEMSKLPKLQADPMQMRQLIQNIVGNALKFHRADTPPHVSISGKVSDEKRRTDRTITLTIRDNGLGFDEKYLDRIFSVFQRLHGREQYEGTGIGLAVCRKIVERHNGTITASSKPGKGATFTIQLPLVHKENEV